MQTTAFICIKFKAIGLDTRKLYNASISTLLCVLIAYNNEWCCRDREGFDWFAFNKAIVIMHTLLSTPPTVSAGIPTFDGVHHPQDMTMNICFSRVRLFMIVGVYNL